jgi:hypothetical protein
LKKASKMLIITMLVPKMLQHFIKCWRKVTRTVEEKNVVTLLIKDSWDRLVGHKKIVRLDEFWWVRSSYFYPPPSGRYIGAPCPLLCGLRYKLAAITEPSVCSGRSDSTDCIEPSGSWWQRISFLVLRSRWSLNRFIMMQRCSICISHDRSLLVPSHQCVSNLSLYVCARARL